MENTKKELEELREEVSYLREKLNRVSLSLQDMLRLRGFSIHSSKGQNAETDKEDDLLLPDERFIEEYYELLKKYSFRLFLRDLIKQRGSFNVSDVTRYATKEVTGGYLKALERMGLLEGAGDGYRILFKQVRSFGDTLEWFVSELLRREFCAQVLRGVKFSGRRVGGDYDIIARINGELCYVEVKSSPPRQVYDREVRAFLRRFLDLLPDVAIFLMDTHLRMKDKLVPMFDDAISELRDIDGAMKRVEAECFTFEDRVFLVNSKPGIEYNIAKIIRYRIRNEFLKSMKGGFQ
ncbi:MAG: hypothetical protein D6726_05905 [Nitrospirae bacterium]|nr:MAG: hypothetical protein D6726_05905 [Nitrospirota bacterium]